MTDLETTGRAGPDVFYVVANVAQVKVGISTGDPGL
jgi:hypothetical protein